MHHSVHFLPCSTDSIGVWNCVATVATVATALLPSLQLSWGHQQFGQLSEQQIHSIVRLRKLFFLRHGRRLCWRPRCKQGDTEKKMKKTWSLSGRKRIYWMYTKRQWNFASGQFPIIKSSLWRWVVFRLSECDLCDLWLVWLVSLFPFLVPFVAGTCACLETFVYFCDVSEESAMLCRILSADLASSQPLSCQAGSLRTGHSFFEAWWHLHGKHAAFIIFVC